MDNAFDAIAGTALGAYLIGVALQGNGPQLVTEASKDWQYLEFLAAIYILYLLHKSDFGGTVVNMLIMTAVTALIIKAAAQADTDYMAILKAFASGEKGLAQTMGELLGLRNA